MKSQAFWFPHLQAEVQQPEGSPWKSCCRCRPPKACSRVGDAEAIERHPKGSGLSMPLSARLTPSAPPQVPMDVLIVDGDGSALTERLHASGRNQRLTFISSTDPRNSPRKQLLLLPPVLQMGKPEAETGGFPRAPCG